MRSSKAVFEFKEFSALLALYKAKLPITKQKFDHLQILKQVIIKDYHSFYDNLPYEKEKKKKK